MEWSGGKFQESSTFNLFVHWLLQALIKHAPFPVTIAKKFLEELSKCQVHCLIPNALQAQSHQENPTPTYYV